MKNKPTLFFIILFFAITSLNGQSYYFHHYQVENGLSNNTVICALQDQQGFLWFGTKDGLNRFNGYTFKTFRNDRDDPSSIGSNFIYSLHEDKNGLLWVGCDRGLFQYDAATESFSPVKKAPANEIMDIQMDDSGRLWFIARMKLYSYDLKTDSLRSYDKAVPVVTSLCKTSDGALWVSTPSGLIKKFSSSDDSFHTFDVFERSAPAVSRWIEKLENGGNGLLLVGTSKHSFKIFDTHTSTYKDIILHSTDNNDIFVRDFIRYSDDEYWIATESGIFIYNIKNGKYVNLKKNYNNPYSISDNAVYTLCKDKEGGIWAGTYFGGINYYPKQYTSFKKYFPQYGSNSISGNAVREIGQDNEGNLWIGTEDAGLNKLETATGRFTHFSAGKAINNIAYSNVHGLLMDGDKLWIGTFHHGLDVLDVKTGRRLKHYNAAKDGLKSDFVSCLYKTRSGKIIAATDRGLCYYNPRNDSFVVITDIPQTFYTKIYEDRNGTIWAGTYSEGIYFFNPGTKKTGRFRYAPADKKSLSGNRINWIFEDAHGALWIATEGGLSKLDRNKGSFTNYNTQNGFPSNIVYAVLEDNDQNFWASTSKGLVCFSPKTEETRIYTKANGLLSDQFNYNSAYKDASGQMYFGSVKGMISFHPAKFKQNTFQPPVYITGFQVFDKELEINKNSSPLKRSITHTNNITLKHSQSTFSIDFAALSFTAPKMTEYAYIMEGMDENWTYLKTNRKVYFTELSPGTYNFKVKASVSNGPWNASPAMLTITILPPFWASTWAFLLYAAAIIGAIYLILKYYHQRQEEKNQAKLEKLEYEKEKELYRAKIEFFTHVAHEIRTPMTLIVGPMQKIMKKVDEVPAIKNNLQIMQRNTDRLMELTTQLLDFRKTEMNGLRLNFVKTDVSEVLKDNYTRFKPAADQKNLTFELHADAPLEAYVDAEALNKIVSNLINNAIKYANTKVYIQLLRPNDYNKLFTIKVKNDGYLIPVEMKERIFETFYRLKETEKVSGTGIGLALSRSLASLHKGSLVLEDPENDLNVFALSLPVHQSVESDMSNPPVVIQD